MLSDIVDTMFYGSFHTQKSSMETCSSFEVVEIAQLRRNLVSSS